MNNIFTSLTLFVHSLVKEVLKPGDKAIDATAGNGNDTLFLAQSVGPRGKVYAFDIQDQALLNTNKLLVENNMLDRVILLKCGHQHLQREVTGPIKAVMFNLGYLPKGDHSIITIPDTTIQAILQALDLLDRGGLITITVYTGHPGGEQEKNAIEELVSNLDKKKWDVLKWSYLNRRTAPHLILLHRREGLNHEN